MRKHALGMEEIKNSADPKETDHGGTCNYYTMCLLLHMYKIFMGIVYVRTEGALDEYSRRLQWFSFVNHIFVVT